MKLNVSYKDYKLQPADFVKGCYTILTSEKAALTKCSEIWEKMEKKQANAYNDTDFGPINSKDIIGASESLY